MEHLVADDDYYMVTLSNGRILLFIVELKNRHKLLPERVADIAARPALHSLCVPTELVAFRQRIGEAGVELILKESIFVNEPPDYHGGAAAVVSVDTMYRKRISPILRMINCIKRSLRTAGR